jgi:hypothetical protein
VKAANQCLEGVTMDTVFELSQTLALIRFLAADERYFALELIARIWNYDMDATGGPDILKEVSTAVFFGERLN